MGWKRIQMWYELLTRDVIIMYYKNVLIKNKNLKIFNVSISIISEYLKGYLVIFYKWNYLSNLIKDGSKNQ